MKKSIFSNSIVSGRGSRVFTSLVILIALISLFGWYSNSLFLTRFSSDEVPMVLSTTYIFLCLAVGLWFYIRPQKKTVNRFIVIASAVIVIGLSCLLVITNLFNYYSNWEYLFINISGNNLGPQPGNMSIVTAILFLISGLSLLFLQSGRKIFKTFSIIFTLILFITSFVLLLAYAFGVPFFYFDNFIPPAVLTVLLFVFVSLALIAASDKNTFFVKTMWKKSTSAKLLRVFLPITIAITVIESLIIIRILPLLNIHIAIGVTLVSLIFVAVVVVVISTISKSIGKALDSALVNLSESESNFRFFFENSPVGKSMTDIDGSLHVNQSFCEMLGYSQKELKEKTWMEISHPDDIQKNKEVVQSLMDNKISKAQFEKRYIHKNGTIIFTDVSVYLQRNINGNPKFFITSVFDITERKLAEVELTESLYREQFLADIVRESSVGIAIGYPDGSLGMCNSAYQKITGYNELELQSIDWNSVLTPPEWDETETEKLKELHTTKKLVKYEKEYIKKDGTRVPVELVVHPHLDMEGEVECYFAFVINITERKRAEEKEKLHLRNINFLSQAAMKFVELPRSSNIYDYVGEQIREFVGKDSYVIVNSVDCKTGFSTIHSVLGVGKFAEIITNKLGRQPVGMKFDVEDPNIHYQDGKLHVYQKGLYGLMFNTVPKVICKSIEKLTSINKIFVIDLAKKEHFFGSVIILLKDKTGGLKNEQLIETFIKQASIAILKRQAEEALRLNEEKLNLIINSSPIGICTVDMLGNFVTTNPVYELMVGYSKKELLELSFYDVTHPNDRPKNKKLFQNMFSLESSSFSMDKKYMRKNGEEIDVSVQAIGIKDSDGNVRFGTAFVDDITERKLAEKEISLSHERYMALFNDSPIPLWEEDFTDLYAYLLLIRKKGHTDLNKYFDENPDELRKCTGMIKILDTNQAALDLHMAENKEQLIENFSETFTENSYLIFLEELISIFEGNNVYESESEVKTLSGDLRYIHIKFKIDYSQPNIVKALMASTDITARKLIEKELIENQKRYKNAQAMGQVGNWEYNPLKDEFWASDEAKRIFGLESDGKDFTTERVEQVISERAQVHQALIDLIEQDKKYDLVFEIISEDKGIQKTVHSIAEVERDALGNPVKVNGVLSDITKQVKADKELKESEEKLNTLFTSLTELVVSHDLVFNDANEVVNYRIVDCNKAFSKFTGISKEDIVGKLATEFYQSDTPPYLEEYSKVALSGNPYEFTSYYAPFDKHLMISVVSPRHGKFATITTDITSMMQIQETILTKNKEMENYLYVASHDLRSPLVNIQGFSQRLKTQADSIIKLVNDKCLEPEIINQLANITDENIPKTLNFIFTNIEKMDTLINGLLKISRTGRMGMTIQKIDMNKLFLKILNNLDFQIKEIDCKVHVNTLSECYGDMVLLDQLFTNIISNSLKYYDEDRPLEITVESETIFNKVVYSIKDTGKGIAQKNMDKIWDVFYQVNPKSGKAGEGIGLSLVKRIVEKHKGKIWVESEENKGTIFHVELYNSIFNEF